MPWLLEQRNERTSVALLARSFAGVLVDGGGVRVEIWRDGGKSVARYGMVA